MGKKELVKELNKALNMGAGDEFDIFDYKDEPLTIKIKKKSKYKDWFIIFDGTHFYLADKDNVILAKARSVKKLIPKGVAEKL